MDPQSAALHYELGLMYADRNQFALALDRFDTAVKHAPRNLDYVANLGLALQNMGLTDRAAETWRLLGDLCQPPRDLARSLVTSPRLRT
jgi:Flp pilus assembly protein TadD